MPDIYGYVFAGGESRRMGRPKPALGLGGSSLLDRAAGTLSRVCTGVAVSGSVGDNRFRSVADLAPGGIDAAGPLVGLFTVFGDARTGWVAALACDMPFVTDELVLRLAGLTNAETDAVVPVQPDGRPQPLCALYNVNACLPVARELLLSGERSPQELLKRLRTKFVEFEGLSDLPGSAQFFFNVNTPSDLEEATRFLGE